MKPLLFCAALALLSSCSEPVEGVQPFIFIALNNPDGFVAPVADVFHVTNRSIVDGNPIFKEFDVDGKDLSLPTSFAIQFSEGIRGNIVDIEVSGLIGGEVVWFAEDSAIADVSEIEMVVRFCGDGLLDEVLPEECDDGDLNSDTEPDACRSSCSAAFCGDAVLDAGEDCDDGNTVEGDGCDSNCTNSQCGNGILAPGEFCLTRQTPTAVGLGPVDLELADINVDGLLDIVVANANSNTVGILRSLGGGQFDLSTHSGFTARTLELADLNNDDRLDIIAGGGSGSNNSFTILRQLAGDTFARQTITTTACTDNKAITSGDFDLDGLPEIVLTCRGVWLQVFANNSSTGGTVSFSGQQILAMDSDDDPAALVSGNFDQDLGGVPDLAALVFSFTTPRLEVFFGTNGGSFTNGTPFPVPVGIFPALFQTDLLASADLTQDNLPEIVAANKNSGEVRLFLSQGNGQFALPQSVPLSFEPTAVVLSDITGDGFEDILVTGNNQLHVLSGLGGANFGAILSFNSGTRPQAIGIGDLNGDGLPDVVTADEGANSVSIFLQDP